MTKIRTTATQRRRQVSTTDSHSGTVQSTMERVDQAMHRRALLRTLVRQLALYERQNGQVPERTLEINGQHKHARQDVVAQLARWLHAEARADGRVIDDLLGRGVVESGAVQPTRDVG
ncbi:MAG TPA: hypothetical protein VF331_24245 [Polyangiales bacterium]